MPLDPEPPHDSATCEECRAYKRDVIEGAPTVETLQRALHNFRVFAARVGILPPPGGEPGFSASMFGAQECDRADCDCHRIAAMGGGFGQIGRCDNPLCDCHGKMGLPVDAPGPGTKPFVAPMGQDTDATLEEVWGCIRDSKAQSDVERAERLLERFRIVHK